MACNYTCDFCGHPLKETETSLVIIVQKQDSFNGFEKKVDDVIKETHEVCESCKNLVKTIFELKKKRMTELEKVLEKQYILKPEDIERTKLFDTFYKEMEAKGNTYEETDKIIENLIRKIKEGKNKIIINIKEE